MEMTFNQYIQNPMGKKNAVFTQTEVYRQLYASKLDKLMVREGGVFKYILYIDNEDYYIHMKVPSEVIENFYYDVVVRFFTKDPKAKERRDLDKYHVQFFSNDPAFVYTFAHAFRTNDMFIEILKPRMSKEAIKKKPKEKNPDEIIGYVKSLFFCYLIMESRALFNKVTYEVYGKKLNKKDLLNDIVDADIKIRKRQEEGEKLRKQKQKEKKRSQTRSNTNNDTDDNIPYNKTVSRTKTSKTTSYSPTVKRSKKR